jgi:hypothetical protein
MGADLLEGLVSNLGLMGRSMRAGQALAVMMIVAIEVESPRGLRA